MNLFKTVSWVKKKNLKKTDGLCRLLVIGVLFCLLFSSKKKVIFYLLYNTYSIVDTFVTIRLKHL
ncbi:MAG: hypothetical protein DBX61_07675 [Clostridiales bacterium]|nr:MAG: hypothetical protein DBX61_07675 [Clostridiales bacterium]